MTKSHARTADRDEHRPPRDRKRTHRAKSATLDRKRQRAAKRAAQGGAR